MTYKTTTTTITSVRVDPNLKERNFLSFAFTTSVVAASADRTKVICFAGVNFINILCMNFLYEHHFGSFFYVHVTREKLPKEREYKKFVRKMLMKLTTGGRGKASNKEQCCCV